MKKTARLLVLLAALVMVLCLALTACGEQDITYVLNGGTNAIVIEGARVYMTHSDCPDHTCERTGKIKYVGQSIICLPNKLSVTIVGEAEDAVDFVS